MKENIFMPKIHDIIIPGCSISETKEIEFQTARQNILLSSNLDLRLPNRKENQIKPPQNNSNEATMRIYKMAQERGIYFDYYDIKHPKTSDALNSASTSDNTPSTL